MPFSPASSTTHFVQHFPYGARLVLIPAVAMDRLPRQTAWQRHLDVQHHYLKYKPAHQPKEVTDLDYLQKEHRCWVKAVQHRDQGCASCSAYGKGMGGWV